MRQVRLSHTDSERLVTLSELSCFCHECMDHRYSECSNSTKTGGYTEFEMKREHPQNSITADADEPERVPIIDLVSGNQVIAGYTDDDEHDYYLLKTAN